MKDYCSPSWNFGNESAFSMNVCDPNNVLWPCFQRRCTEADVIRYFYGATECKEGFDYNYNEIAHIATYCLGLGVSVGDVLSELNLQNWCPLKLMG